MTNVAEPHFAQERHVVAMTGAEYIGLAHTKSHLRTAPRSVQERFGRALTELLASRGVAPTDVIEVPYIVDCWTAERNEA
jgi:hypothetical protein